MKAKTFMAAAALLVAGCATVREPAHDTLVSHRGESIDAPENTMPAYRTAVSRGFGFECDIYLSKDKRLFTFHDSNLTRTTGGANTSRCVDVDWEGTVSRLNVGGWGRWKGSQFDPTRPALLEEVLSLAVDGRFIYVEVKDNDPTWAPYIRDVVRSQTRATPRNTLFITFGDKIAKALKKELPEYRLYFLMGAQHGGEKRYWTADDVIAKLRDVGADGVDIQFAPEAHDAVFVKKIHDAGFSFHVWTIDGLETAKQAFAVGADTLTTNCAQKLLDGYLAQQGE